MLSAVPVGQEPCFHMPTQSVPLERYTGFEPVHSAWKADVLTVEHQYRIVQVFEYFCLVENSEKHQVIQPLGLLDYGHILALYFALAIP